jgi:hypothetical protein
MNTRDTYNIVHSLHHIQQTYHNIRNKTSDSPIAKPHDSICFSKKKMTGKIQLQTRTIFYINIRKFNVHFTYNDFQWTLSCQWRSRTLLGNNICHRYCVVWCSKFSSFMSFQHDTRVQWVQDVQVKNSEPSRAEPTFIHGLNLFYFYH